MTRLVILFLATVVIGDGTLASPHGLDDRIKANSPRCVEGVFDPRSSKPWGLASDESLFIRVADVHDPSPSKSWGLDHGQVSSSPWGLASDESSFIRVADVRDPLDGIPWPWGSECPVYAQLIEGLWLATSSGGRGHKVYTRFQVQVQPRQQSSSWMVYLTRLGAGGDVLAKGQVLFYQGSEGVKVPLRAQNFGGCDYWAHLHSYTRRPDSAVCMSESEVEAGFAKSEPEQRAAQKSLIQTRFLDEQIILLSLEPMQSANAWGRACRAKKYFLRPATGSLRSI